ncbi:hypothetical protein [Sodalis ligni]|nr:hypothetical protein [Sodalis ligni]
MKVLFAIPAYHGDKNQEAPAMTCSILSCNSGKSSDVLSHLSDTQCQGVGTAVKSAGNRNLTFTGNSGLSSNSFPGKNGLVQSPAFLEMGGKIPIFSIAAPSDGVDSADGQSTTSKCNPANAPVNIVKTEPATKNANKPASAKIKIITEKIKKATPLILMVFSTVILTGIAVAGTFSLSFPPLIIASIVVYVLYVLWRACNAGKKDWAAIMIGSWASNKAKPVQNAAAGFIAGVSAKLNGANLKATWLAMKLSFYKSREKGTETGMACANGVGVSVAKVQKLAKQQDCKVSEASYAGAMAGSNAGININGTIEGSSKIGEMAGSGAFHGAMVGREVDMLAEKGADLATAGIHAYWRFWLPDIFPAQPEGERSAAGDNRLFRSADLSKHDESYVTALVNAYWRFWLQDAVAPAHSQRSAFTMGNDAVFIEKDKLAEKSPSIVHVDSRLGKTKPDAQRTNPKRDRTTNGEVSAGLGEWFGAYTGGMAGGLYAGLDHRSGGRFKHAASAIGQQVSAVRNFMGTSTVASTRNRPAFPEID